MVFKGLGRGIPAVFVILLSLATAVCYNEKRQSEVTPDAATQDAMALFPGGSGPCR